MRNKILNWGMEAESFKIVWLVEIGVDFVYLASLFLKNVFVLLKLTLLYLNP